MTANFSAGAVLTAANLNAAINTDTINAQTGAGYTLVLSDAGKTVTLSNASAQTLTIPTNASVAFATGTVIEVLNIGAGTWTLGGAGVTINGTTSIPNKGGVRLLKTATDTWWAAAVDAAVGGGLVYVTSASFSGSGAVNVNGCFTSAYAAYRIVISFSSSTANALTARLRASGVDASGANYDKQALSAYGSTASAVQNNASTAFSWGQGGTSRPSLSIVDVYNPQIAESTAHTGLCVFPSTNSQIDYYGGLHTLATSYDGFSLIPSTGTVTGTVRVYAYKN